MMRLSRRQLARYGAEQLLKGQYGVIDQLAAYLVENKRAKETPLLALDIEKALQAHGLVSARVQSAHELDAEEKSAIERVLASFYVAKEVQMVTVQDNSVLGGVVIKTATDEFDGSLKRSINRLKALNV